jgi:hypothetical protein
MKSKKQFDAVKMMREIRDRLSKDFMNMNYEEQKRYIRQNVKHKIRAAKEVEQNVNVP